MGQFYTDETREADPRNSGAHRPRLVSRPGGEHYPRGHFSPTIARTNGNDPSPVWTLISRVWAGLFFVSGVAPQRYLIAPQQV